MAPISSVTIWPYMRVDCASAEGYFLSNLEGVCKDVECTFGVLKKRWHVLNNGFVQREMEICSKFFITCCWLNNFLLDLMERSNVRVGHGDDDSIWLSGTTEEEKEQAERDEEDEGGSKDESESEEDHELLQAFLQHRGLLVKHLHHFCHKGAIQARLTPHQG